MKVRNQISYDLEKDTRLVISVSEKYRVVSLSSSSFETTDFSIRFLPEHIDKLKEVIVELEKLKVLEAEQQWLEETKAIFAEQV